MTSVNKSAYSAVYFDIWGSEAVQLGRAMISHTAFYLLQYVDINLELWSEAG